MKTKLNTLIIGTLLLAATACNAEKKDMVDLSITATDMAYTPTELHLNKNVPYTLNFENKGNVVHDWNVKSISYKKLNVKKSENSMHHHSMENTSDLHVGAESNSKDKIAFMLLKSGTYEYYCSIPGHKEAGMKGLIYIHD